MPKLATRQRNIDREVARLTGEDVRTIRRYGFSVIDLHDQHFDPEADIRDPLMIDWDDLDGHSRAGSFVTCLTIPV